MNTTAQAPVTPVAIESTKLCRTMSPQPTEIDTTLEWDQDLCNQLAS